MNDVFFLLDIRCCLWPLSHKLCKDEDGTVPNDVMRLFRYEVICSEASTRRLVLSFLEHLHLGVELLCQVEEYFLLTQRVAVYVKFNIRVASPLCENELTQLLICDLLTWKGLIWSSKRIVHVDEVNLDGLFRTLNHLKLFYHLGTEAEIASV